MGSGSHDLRKEIRFMLPNNELFLGCLFPLKQSEEEPEENEELSLADATQDTEIGGKDASDLLSTLRKPSSISLNFITKDKGKIELETIISVYVRIKPNIKDYKDYIERTYRTDWGEKWDVDEFIEENFDVIKTVAHPMIWRRIDIKIPKIEFNLKEVLEVGEISKEFNLFEFVRKTYEMNNLYCKPEDDLDLKFLKKTDEDKFYNFWENISGKSEVERRTLDWKIRLSIRSGGILPGYENENFRLFTIILTNITEFSEKTDYELKDIFDPVIYNSKMYVFLNDIKIEKTQNKWRYTLPYSKQITTGDLPPKYNEQIHLIPLKHEE